MLHINSDANSYPSGVQTLKSWVVSGPGRYKALDTSVIAATQSQNVKLDIEEKINGKDKQMLKYRINAQLNKNSTIGRQLDTYVVEAKLLFRVQKDIYHAWLLKTNYSYCNAGVATFSLNVLKILDLQGRKPHRQDLQNSRKVVQVKPMPVQSKMVLLVLFLVSLIFLWRLLSIIPYILQYC